MQASPEQRRAFAKAQALRSNGQFAQAQQAFAHFVQRYPSTSLTDDAWWALGEIATTLGNPQQAQRAYQTILADFPNSVHIPQVYLKLGIVFYQLQAYDHSLTTLRHFLKLESFPKQQAVAHYYLGMIAEAQHRYADAVVEWQLTMTTSPDGELVKQARTHIFRLVREHLTPAELERLAHQYSTTYPGDLLLLQLARLYREAGSEPQEMAVLQRFTAAFPEHPDLQTVIDRLHDLQAALATDRSNIGVLLPLSGEGRQYGQEALHGVELAIATWQENHPDMELSLTIRDSHGTSAEAREALRSLVYDAHVIGVVGPLFSQVALDLAPLAARLHVPVISPYAPQGAFPALSPYAFRNSLTDDLQARFLAQYAVQELHLHRFAILYPDEPYGRTLKDRFIEHIIQLQGEVVAVVSYPPETTDFSSQIRRLGGVDDETLRDLQAGAETASPGTPPEPQPPLPYEAIFIPDYYDKVGLIAPTLVFYNITGVQLLGTDGWDAPELIDIGERFVEGAIFVDGFFAASPVPLVKEFVERFKARYGEVPGLLSAQAYDTLRLLVHVLQEGAKTRLQLRDGLLRMQNFAGVSGTTSMRTSGDAEKILYLLTVQNGHIVQLN